MCIFMHFGIISKLNLQCNLYSIFFFRKTSFFLTSLFELLWLLHSYCNGATDWAYRLNSYQASNWLYGFHPRVSNSHWLLSPITATMNPQDFRNRIFMVLLNGRGCGIVPGSGNLLLRTSGVSYFFVSYSKKKEKRHSLICQILRKRVTEVIVFLWCF